MTALIIGVVLILAGVYAVLPAPFGLLNWLPFVLDFIRGALPLVALSIGFVSVFIGIADLKDRKNMKQEEAESQENPLDKK